MGVDVIWVTHDLGVVARLTKRMVEMLASVHGGTAR